MIRKSGKKAWVYLWVTLAVIVIDQLVKHLVLRYCQIDVPVRLLPFLNILLTFNHGSAFGFLNNADGWQVFALSAVSILMSVLLLGWLCNTLKSDTWMALSLSLILGGALGNLIDRVRMGFVVDYVDFHIGSWHFAIFNFADAAISVGVVILILRLLLVKDES